LTLREAATALARRCRPLPAGAAPAPGSSQACAAPGRAPGPPPAPAAAPASRQARPAAARSQGTRPPMLTQRAPSAQRAASSGGPAGWPASGHNPAGGGLARGTPCKSMSGSIRPRPLRAAAGHHQALAEPLHEAAAAHSWPRMPESSLACHPRAASGWLGRPSARLQRRAHPTLLRRLPLPGYQQIPPHILAPAALSDKKRTGPRGRGPARHWSAH